MRVHRICVCSVAPSHIVRYKLQRTHFISSTLNHNNAFGTFPFVTNAFAFRELRTRILENIRRPSQRDALA